MRVLNVQWVHASIRQTIESADPGEVVVISEWLFSQLPQQWDIRKYASDQGVQLVIGADK